MRVLLLNRPNAFTQRGGDTVLMERLQAGLAILGYRITAYQGQPVDLTKFDIAHIFNFATPEITEQFARACVSSSLPYVVTTLYEDWPRFFTQMNRQAGVLIDYVNRGQRDADWQALEEDVDATAPAVFPDNTYAARHAAVLLATGAEEVRTLERDYGTSIRVALNHPGGEIVHIGAGENKFTARTGLSDFILSVGRLEARKNQLGLLAALQDDPVPIVFATGGFTYQPEYEAACRAFRRKGPTHFIERVSEELLSGMYAAARLHALPSWYELPGMVSLEAARYGIPVVAGEYGTLSDYLGAEALYVRPSSLQDIRNAVIGAWYSDRAERRAEIANGWTWARAADELHQVYQQVQRHTDEADARELASKSRQRI